MLWCKRVTTFAVSCSFIYGHFRDWSLITGRGGYKTGGGGGHVKFYPYKKVLATLKGGHKKCWGSFYAVA